MEHIVESYVYAPIMDESGNYVDKIPEFHIIKKGLWCPCGSRNNKLYDNYITFPAHIKSKTHQKWITSLNVKIENEKILKELEDISKGKKLSVGHH
jgi:hypothetical protein